MTDKHMPVEDHELPKGLVYVSDDMPGFTRRKHGKGFEYLSPDGTRVEAEKQIARIDALAIPPAYKDVWICMKPNGHLQATGHDDRSRKQYRYHTQWAEFRSTRKFSSLAEFGDVLPRIRRKVTRTLRADEPDKDFAVAALVRLLDKGHLRIGSSDSSVTGAVGATSLLHRNLKLNDGKIKLDYVAKGGKRVRRQLSDRTLLRTLEQIDNLPGKRLFQYIGRDGDVHPLDSGDVNEWLKDAAGHENVSAKTFRTWAGTLAAFRVAQKSDKLTIKAMCEAAADELRNTPTICRGSYVHPAVINLAEIAADKRNKLINCDIDTKSGLTNAETQLLRFLP